jgi:hypothetical protein
MRKFVMDKTPIKKPYKEMSTRSVGFRRSRPFSTGSFCMLSTSGGSQARPRAWGWQGEREGGREGGREGWIGRGVRMNDKGAGEDRERKKGNRGGREEGREGG